MTKDTGSKNSPDKPMSADDADLWQSVADSTEPLRKGKNRMVDRPEHEHIADPAPDTSPTKQKPSPVLPRREAIPVKPPAPPPVAKFERKEARRLSSGRTSVDARIDLHGMRQREAHGSLKAFLASAQSRDHRHVLVITGKGGTREHDGSYERGVLNREVPRWLSEPEFSQWVVSFAPASKRHGGEGALYVRLRRAK